MTLTSAHLDAQEDERNYDSSYGDDDSHEREYDDSDYGDEGDDSLDASDGDTQVPEGSQENPTIVALQNQIAELNRRYSGQTRKVGELMQANQQQHAAYRQERREILEAYLRERIQDLPREEQDEKIALLRSRLDDEDRATVLSQREQMVGEGLREHYLQSLSQQYGVDINALRNFRDITDAEFFAAHESQRIRQEQQTQKRNSRRTKKQDTFDAPRQTSAPPKPPKNMDEAESAFLRLARRR